MSMSQAIIMSTIWVMGTHYTCLDVPHNLATDAHCITYRYILHYFLFTIFSFEFPLKSLSTRSPLCSLWNLFEISLFIRTCMVIYDLWCCLQSSRTSLPGRIQQRRVAADCISTPRSHPRAWWTSSSRPTSLPPFLSPTVSGETCQTFHYASC